MSESAPAAESAPWAVFVAFLRLGLTSFGGPVAHLGYFRREIVDRRGWVDDSTFADLVALCQFLPGPASSQVGMAIGILRGGVAGAFAAWLGFTLPSAVLMIAFAYGAAAARDAAGSGWLVGLKAMAVAVVAHAVWNMGRSLCPDAMTRTLALASAALVLLWPLIAPVAAGGQIAAIVLGALVGRFLMSDGGLRPATPMRPAIGRRFALMSAALFLILLAGLPLAAAATGNAQLAIVDGFYRSGSLVFGGGHVLLPLLDAVVVPPGWVDHEQFLAGYGAAQALPGPLFAFSAYLGAAMHAGAGGWLGGLICLAAIFLPSFLLLFAAMPFWAELRARADVRMVLAGVNAAVVGLLLAALYHPVWTATVKGPVEFVFVLAAFAMLTLWRRPPWQVALLAAAAGAVVFN